MLMAANTDVNEAVTVSPTDRVQVLLIEDDDGDAFLVEELLRETGARITVQRVRLLAEAGQFIPAAGCILLDLGLPDSQGLHGLQRLLEREPDAAVVVLTGMSDEHLGEEAVRAGAQDYLVKGDVTGSLLHRVIRYAIERRRWDKARHALHTAQINALENARLERGLLPSPVLTDPRLTVSAQYRAGGRQGLLGGDFYDVVQAPGGWVHALIGDVCGHGPSEAALGVCLRVAWRALMLAGRPADETLSAVQQVLAHEQYDDAMFATVCMMSVAPDRRSGILRLAGHPAPLLVTPAKVTELSAAISPPPGLNTSQDWTGTEIELGDAWSLLMYTDGLIEGRVDYGPHRLGAEGLIGLVRDRLSSVPFNPARVSDGVMLAGLIDQVCVLNNGDLNDDVAILALGCS
jgi:serine phosphatase RsbU (regulator of sigma subunit)